MFEKRLLKEGQYRDRNGTGGLPNADSPRAQKIGVCRLTAPTPRAAPHPLCAALLRRHAAEPPRHATPPSRHADRGGTAAPPPPRAAGPVFCRANPSRAEPARRGAALNRAEPPCRAVPSRAVPHCAAEARHAAAPHRGTAPRR